MVIETVLLWSWSSELRGGFLAWVSRRKTRFVKCLLNWRGVAAYGALLLRRIRCCRCGLALTIVRQVVIAINGIAAVGCGRWIVIFLILFFSFVIWVLFKDAGVFWRLFRTQAVAWLQELLLLCRLGTLLILFTLYHILVLSIGSSVEFIINHLGWWCKLETLLRGRHHDELILARLKS